MEKKKTGLLILGAILLAVSVLFIIAYIKPDIVAYLIGSGLIVAFVGLAIKTIIDSKKLLSSSTFIGILLLAVGISALVLNDAIANFITLILNVSVIGIGSVLIIDAIIHFVKGRSLVPNILEIIFGTGLLTIGILSLCIAELSTLIYLIVGIVGIIGSIVIIIASVTNFKKYLKVTETESNNKQTPKSKGKKK